MAEELPNLGLLIKLMKMTTSSHDGEALAAVRKANEQLLKFGGDWEALLRGKVTVIGDPFLDVPKPPPSDRYNHRTAPPPPRPQAPKPAWNPQPPPAPPRPQKPNWPNIPPAAPQSRRARRKANPFTIDDLL